MGFVMTEPDNRQRQLWWAATAVLAVYTGLALVSRLPGIGVGNDDAMYYFLAKSLLQGSYRDIFLPDAPIHLQYPPGWPLLMAPFEAVFGNSPEVLLLLPLLLSVGGLLLLFDSARRILPPVGALAVLAIAAFNPLLITYGGRLKSEAAFFFFAMLAIWALGAPSPSRRRLLLGSAAAIASAFMRSAGVAVIAAVFLHFALERRWKWALGFGAVAAVTFGPWLAWSFLGPRQTLGRSYAGDLTIGNREPMLVGKDPRVAYVLGAALRLSRYVAGHLHAMMGFKQAQGTLVDNIGWLALLGTAGLAGVAVLWRKLRILLLTVLGLFGILAVWTWADRRFLHPVVPMVGLVLVVGADALGRRAGRHGSTVACLLVLALLAPGTWLRTSDLVSRGWACTTGETYDACFTPIEVSFLEAADAAQALPDSAVVLTNREAAFAYHSGRLASFASEMARRTGDDMLDFMRRKGVTHILITRIGDTGAVELAEQLVALCRRLAPLGEFGEGAMLFEVRPAPREGPAADSTCARTTRGLAAAQAYQQERNRRFDFFGVQDPRE